MDAIIEMEEVSYRRRTVVLDKVSWRVEPHEHWVILGPNGSGKTSLLSLLTGYLTPTSGTIRLCGETYGQYDWRELRKSVGVVSSALNQKIEPRETASDIVVSGKYAMLNFWGEIQQEDVETARALLSQIGCGYLADRSWRFLSQGERQRVMIARALMADLKLLVLDEPCAGLDPVARENFLAFIESLARKPQSPVLVLVTHHVEEITPAFSHALLLHGGKVAAGGPTAEVLTEERLGEVFEAGIKLKHEDGRYAMRVPTAIGYEL